MNGNQLIPAPISLAALFATVAAWGWIYLNEQEKGGPAQPETRPTISVPASEQTVTARLWEDPLQAVQPESGKGGSQADTLTNLAKTLKMNLAEPQGNRVCLLVVPIPGTPFPDDNETRLRLRYSIQMALAQKQFAPQDRDHLGYFLFDWPGGDSWHRSTTQRSEFRQFSKTVAVPYEWFSSRTNDNNVLVVWFPDQYLNNEPLCSLAYLRSNLCVALSAKQIQRFSGPFVVGPRSSDTLKSIAQQCIEKDPDQSHVCKRILETNLCIHSPQATAPDGLIGLKATSLWSQTRADLRDKLAMWFSPPGSNCCGSANSWCYLRNYIATDDELTDLIAVELNYRLPKFHTEKGDSVLVLAEADTSYGQSLPVALQQSVRNYLNTSTTLSSLKAEGVRSPTAVGLDPMATFANTGLIVVRYLRGLDQAKGQMGGESLQTANGPKSPEEALAAALTQKASPAQGESQLDYAQRLVAKLKANLSNKRVRAVGILGGDIYDKLILLQAVRNKFKEAVFFTTDLDARLWDPTHLPYTRNLIVASSSDVYIPPPAKGLFDIPPFRDVYQVAVFNACCDALEKVWYGNISPAGAQGELDPGIFELGRHGPVKLLVQEEVANSQSLASRISQEWKQLALHICILCISLVLIFIAGLIWRKLHVSSFYAFINKTWAWVVSTIIYGLMIVAGFCHLAKTTLSAQPGGEPFLWAEGISAWPTEAARLLIFLCVLWMLVLLCLRARTHQEKLATEFLNAAVKSSAPQTGEAPSASKKPYLERLWLWFKWVWNKLFPRWLGVEELQSKSSDPSSSSPVSASDNTNPAGKDRPHTTQDKYLKPARVWLRWLWKDLFPHWPDAKDLESESSVNPNELFNRYKDTTQLGVRLLRVLLGTFLYLLLISNIFWICGIPPRTNVRGSWARGLDMALLVCSVSALLFLVFYILDSVWQTSRILNCLSTSHPSKWPMDAQAAKDVAKDFEVPATNLKGLNWYLDVRFAAETTQEAGMLLLLPFIIQFLMLLARNSYFDNWTWPPALVVVFVCNVLLAVAAWCLLRATAQKVRVSALKQLKSSLLNVRFQLASAGSADTLAKDKLALKEMIKRIEQEKAGAYSRIIQDPALLAVMLPTGALGILSILVQAFLGKL